MSVTGYAGMINLKGLSLEVMPPEEVYADTPAAFNLVLTNAKTRLPSFLLEISSLGPTVVFPFLKASGTLKIPVLLNFKERGYASLERVSVGSAFPVNFFVRSWTLPVACSFLVFPSLIPSPLTDDSGDSEKRELGATLLRGAGGEVERILEYTGREPLKQIHWKLSARSEEFKVKEFGEPSAEPLVIDIDSLSGSLEGRISAAAWIVRNCGMKRPVGLKLGADFIPPVQGKSQIFLLLGKLAILGK